jgi:hypothetical protein
LPSRTGGPSGCALHAPAFGFAVARFVEESAHQADALGACRESAIAGVSGIADFRALPRGQRKGDIEPARRQKAGGAIGPFHQHNGILRQIVEAELGQFGGARKPVEIGVHHRKARQLVGLQEGERGTRHLNAILVGEITDQRARERGLAGAEIARQGHQVARLERAGDVAGKAHRGLLVRQVHGEARAA